MIDEAAFKEAKVLVVDPDSAAIAKIEEVLRSAQIQTIDSVTDPAKAAGALVTGDPDLILLSLDSPAGDGIEILQRIRLAIPPDISLPILALSADSDPATRRRSMLEGANDFLHTPLDPTELLTRVRNLLEIRFLSIELAGGRRFDELVDRVARQRTAAQEDIQVELLSRFAAAAELSETQPKGRHAEGVQLLSMMLARSLGFPEDQAQLIGRASLLHDVGKVAIPEEIWGKAGRLTADEYERVKEHASAGADLLSEGRSPLLWLAEEIARYHHERWDGTGYFGLSGEDIPFAARIVAVADAYDALTSERPYRPALSSSEAIEEIKREKNHQFDPRVVDAFLGVQG